MPYNYYRIQQIGAIEAIQIALMNIPGDVIKLELETEQGLLIYEIVVRTYTGVSYEVKINAYTGEVITIERETD